MTVTALIKRSDNYDNEVEKTYNIEINNISYIEIKSIMHALQLHADAYNSAIVKNIISVLENSIIKHTYDITAICDVHENEI